MSDQIPDWSQPAPVHVPYQSQAAGGVALSGRGLDLIRKIRPWTLFLSIIGFLATLMSLGFFVLILIAALLKLPGLQTGPNMPSVLELALIYLASGIMYLIPSIMLMRISLSIGRLLAFGTPENLDEVISLHHRFFRLAGILTIAAIMLFIVVVIVSIFFAIARPAV